MARIPALLVTALLAAFHLVAPAGPASASDDEICYRCGAEAAANGSNVDVTVVAGASEKVSGRGDGMDGPAPGRTKWRTVEEYVAPACSGNGVGGADDMCMAALSCPADNLVRFWVWHRVTEWQVVDGRTEKSVGTWKQEDGSFCLGPDDPGITPIGVVISRVQTGFQSLPIPAFTPQISPAPSTLVNIPTKLSAGSAEPVTLTTEPLAGIVVTVTATPTEWHWTFGDGDTAVTTVPATTHTYEKAQRVGASVTVFWSGTFTIPGSNEVFPIRNQAEVPGATAEVDVRQARTELVRD